MRLGRRLAKILIWGLVLIVLITAGAAWFAYALGTDSETAARLIKALIPDCESSLAERPA